MTLGHQNQASDRNRSIRLAVLTSLLSKSGTIILRLISIPVAIRVLGIEEFGVYATIMVVVGMTDSLHVGIGPALTQGISAAVARGDRREETGLFVTALQLSATLTLLIASIGLVVILLIPIPVLFGDQFSPYADSMRRALIIAIALVTIQVICVVCERARDGYQETRYNNTWAAAANFLSAASLFGVLLFPTIEFLVLAITGPIVLAKLGNTLQLIAVQRRHLMPWFSAFRTDLVRPLVVDGGRFTVTNGLSALIEYGLVPYFVARYAGPSAAGLYAVMVTIHISLTGLIQMVVMPMWPAVVDARTRRDYAWIRQSGARLQWLGAAIAILVACGLIALGPWMFRLWIGDDFTLDRLSIAAFGAYFALHLWRRVNAMLAIGVGKITASVCVILCESTLVFIVSTVALRQGATIGILYASMAVCLLLVSGWLFPRLYRRQLHRLEVASP